MPRAVLVLGLELISIPIAADASKEPEFSHLLLRKRSHKDRRWRLACRPVPKIDVVLRLFEGASCAASSLSALTTVSVRLMVVSRVDHLKRLH
jgi:hypothetical protein